MLGPLKIVRPVPDEILPGLQAIAESQLGLRRSEEWLRIEAKPFRLPGDELPYICHCMSGPAYYTPSPELPRRVHFMRLKVETVMWQPGVASYIWIGQCPQCDRVYWG